MKLQQLLWNLRGETLNMAWTSNNYKNVQSLMKWSGLSHPQQRVTFRPAISRSKTKKKKGELNAWCCVCFWLFRLSVCKCAVCVCGSLHVCFHQRRCVFSMSYTNDSSGAGVFNFSDVFFFKFSPWKRNKRLFEWRFLFLSGKYPRGSFLKKCKIPDHVIIKTYTNHRGDWITPTRLPEW